VIASAATSTLPRALPLRDPFRYGDEAKVVTGMPTPAFPVPAATPLPVSKSAALSVTGLIRKDEGLRALVVVGGELSVVGPGERAGRYRVIEIDPDAGVTFDGPDGIVVVALPD
jgi:hypothetical protein